MHLSDYKRPNALANDATTRIAQLLDIETNGSSDELWLADQVANGLPTKSAIALHKTLESSNIIGTVIPESFLGRGKKEPNLSKEMSERLYEVTKVVDAVCATYNGNSEKIEYFLSRSHQLLDGRSPLEVASSSSAGSDAVLNLIRRAELGLVL